MAPSNTTDKGKMPPVLSLPTEVQENTRFVELCQAFVKKYNCEPEYFIRVPGRVNLIGEHIDYCGYSVCPMAIQQDIVIAVKSSQDSLIKLTNTDEKHEDFCTDINNISIEVVEGLPPKWHNYVLCGIKGVLEEAPVGHIPVGFLAAVTGNVPLASGLSSSSALVSAAALMTTQANKLPFTKAELAELSARAERYIGTQGGGMDQAIAFLATSGSAKHIEFDPIRTTEVQLPPDAVFVIAHSLHTKNKAATSDYNQRVAECRLACQLMAKRKGLPWQELKKLSQLQSALKASLAEMETLVHEVLHEQPYTKEEVCQELELNEKELENASLGPLVMHVKTFKLHQRALHVFQEAGRVLEFCQVCREDPSSHSLLALGNILNASHHSLSDLYECSHPELDRLVKLANKKALGSRLTGAGWGGCMVSLATQSSAQELVDLLKEEFYSSNNLAKGRDLDSLVFITAPESGAQVYMAQAL